MQGDVSDTSLTFFLILQVFIGTMPIYTLLHTDTIEFYQEHIDTPIFLYYVMVTLKLGVNKTETVLMTRIY